MEYLAAGPRDPAPVGSPLAARSAGAFPGAPLCHFLARYATPCVKTCPLAAIRGQPALLSHAIPPGQAFTSAGRDLSP